MWHDTGPSPLPYPPLRTNQVSSVLRRTTLENNSFFIWNPWLYLPPLNRLTPSLLQNLLLYRTQPWTTVINLSRFRHSSTLVVSYTINVSILTLRSILPDHFKKLLTLVSGPNRKFPLTWVKSELFWPCLFLSKLCRNSWLVSLQFQVPPLL